MIEKLFVIHHGMCIYEYKFSNSISIDSQMLSGFLSAIGSFAQETFQSGLSSVQIRNDKKLNFYLDEETSLLFCAISDNRDNNILLDKILGKVAKRFVELKKQTLIDHPNHLEKYKDFDSEIVILLKNQDKVRNKRTMIKGLFAGLGTLIALAIAFIVVFSAYGLFAIQEVLILSLIIFQTVALSACSFVAGYVAGTKATGKKAGIWFYILIFILISGMIPAVALVLAIFAPLAILVCAAAGSYGGEICDRRKLYPLKDTDEKEVKTPKKR